MARGLIIALGLDEFIADYILRTLKPSAVAFIVNDATVHMVPSLVQRNGIVNHKECFLKNIFSTNETVQEFLQGFEWLTKKQQTTEIFVDATNCITAVETATYVSASFFDLFRDVLGIESRIRLIYVHAKYEKNPSGVFSEVRGSEQLIELERPIDSLGFVLVFEGVRAFNSGRYEQAEESFVKASIGATGDKTLLCDALAALSEAYREWDRMQFERARDSMNRVIALLEKVYYYRFVPTVIEHARLNMEALGALVAQTPKSVVLDLYSNATRREREGRLDDAVGRLYACLERIVQHQLAGYGIDTSRVDPAALLPSGVQALTEQFGAVPEELELKRAIVLLASYVDDPVGHAFTKIGTKAFTGLLGIRNRSVLAHGIKPIGQSDFDTFKKRLFLPVFEAYRRSCSIPESGLKSHDHVAIHDIDSILHRNTIDCSSIVVTPAAVAY